MQFLNWYWISDNAGETKLTSLFTESQLSSSKSVQRIGMETSTWDIFRGYIKIIKQGIIVQDKIISRICKEDDPYDLTPFAHSFEYHTESYGTWIYYKSIIR